MIQALVLYAARLELFLKRSYQWNFRGCQSFPNACFTSIGQNADWGTVAARGIGSTTYAVSQTQITFGTM